MGHARPRLALVPGAVPHHRLGEAERGAAPCTAVELAACIQRPGRLSAGELQRWLLAEGLAVEHDGRLEPTAHGRQLGGASS